MIDALEAGLRPVGAVLPGPVVQELEIVVPDRAARGVGRDQVDERAVGGAHGRDPALAFADPLLPVGVEQRLGAADRAVGVVDPQRRGADRGAVQLEVLGGGAVLLAVEHEVGAALAVEVDGLRAVPPGMAEAERAHEVGQRRAGRARRPRTRGTRRRRAGAAAAGPAPPCARASTQISERSPSRAVMRAGAARKSSLKISSDSGPVVAGGQDRAHEAGHVERALAGEVAEVAAPGQHVHLEPRRIGELHEEDLLARHLGEAGRVVAERQGVEAVDDQPERRVVDRAHDVPGLPPQRDVAAEGERLVADAQAAPGGALGDGGEVGRGPRGIVDRGRLHVAAHQHEIGAERLHHVELALGPVQVARALRLRHALEVAQRLVERDRQAEPVADRLHVGRRAVEGQEVVLEDLDAVEPGRCRRLELVRQRAAEADGGDGLGERGRGGHVPAVGKGPSSPAEGSHRPPKGKGDPAR